MTLTSTSSPQIRRKRLLFRSWHRGTREADLILGRFADEHLAGFDDGRLDRYETLLDCADPDIFAWVSGRSAPPPEHDHDVMHLLISFSNCDLHPPNPHSTPGTPASAGGRPGAPPQAGEGTGGGAA